MKKIVISCMVILWSATAMAQITAHTSLKKIISAIDTLHKHRPAEKLYLHLDKPYYATGDTMRFKAYLLDEALFASARSGVMYVELINDSSRVCKRQTIIVTNGYAIGDIVLKKTWYAGNYTLRAYTSWMRNFGVEHFFTRQLNIIPSNNQQWLVNSRVTFDKDKNVKLELHFSSLSHQNIGFRDMQLSILHGTSILLKSKTRTDANGIANISFGIPEKLANEQLSLLAEDISKEGNGRKITLPVQFDRPDNTDLQFMPEGGHLVAGIATRIGFKAIGEDGKGADVSGKVYNSKQEEVAAFQSAYKGMGSFELSPQAGETYIAKVIVPGGTIKNYPLPAAEQAGIALRIDTKSNDSLAVNLNIANPLPTDLGTATATAPATYYLIGLARDKVCYGAKVVFKDKEIHKAIAKNVFPTGIVKFVLLDEVNRPVTQRMVFC